MDWIQNLRLNYLNRRAFKSFLRRDFHSAISCYEKVLKICPDWSAAIANKALCHYELGELEQALELIELAVSLAPEESDYQFNKIIMLHQKGAIDEAYVSSVQLLKMVPDDPEYLSMHAYLQFQKKQYARALQTYQKLEGKTDDPISNTLCIADCYSKLGDIPACREQLLKVLLEAPENTTALNNLGFSRLKTKEYEAAITDFDHAIRL